jgi:ketosteroid isomerase-like protein
VKPPVLQVVGLGGGVYRGHEGLRSFFREWHEAWERIEYDFEDLIDASGDRVISVVTRRGRGRASGAEVELPLALVWTIRNEKVVRVVWFPSREEALEAVGLRDG